MSVEKIISGHDLSRRDKAKAVFAAIQGQTWGRCKRCPEHDQLVVINNHVRLGEGMATWFERCLRCDHNNFWTDYNRDPPR